jgi:hypothetical protein
MADEDKAEEGATEVEAPGRARRLLEKIEHSWLEIAATALLALATILSAYSAYQSAHWHGIEEEHFNKSSQALVRASELDDTAMGEKTIDIMMATDYLDAMADGNAALAQSYKKMGFSDPLKAGIDAWEKALTENRPNTPKNPFLMPEYVNKHAVESKAFKVRSEQEVTAALYALGRSNSFLLLTVLFATVLFFAGVGTKFNAKGVKVTIIVMGFVVFLVSAAMVLLI